MQLDLKKTFDRIKHSAVLQALQLQGASLQCVAALSTMLSASSLTFSLDGVTAHPVQLERGLPQGAPESPLAFIVVVEMIMRPLVHKWRTHGWGWFLDEFWLGFIGYADDIILAASSHEQMTAMIAETIQAFEGAGLEVGTDQGKSHWTS